MQTQEPALVVPKAKATPNEVQSSWQVTVQPWLRATWAVLPVFLITRFVFLLLTYFGGVLFFVPNYWAGTLSAHDVLYTWYRWDAIRYATIAARGYISLDYAAFFPLYPALERAVSFLLPVGIFEAGMLISNVAFLGSLIVLYRFVEIEFDRDTAKRTVLYLSIFPTALFFFTAYNESLFLLFSLISFYAMRQSSWWLAGLFGGLATLTRSIGLLLLIVFFCEFLRQTFPYWQRAWKKKRLISALYPLPNLIPALFIPIGLGIYAFTLNMRFGDPLAFSHAQMYWREGLSPPWIAPALALKSIVQLSPYTFVVPHDIIELTSLGLFLTLMVLCFVGPERLAKSQWTFALFGLMALIYALLFPGAPGANGLPYDPMPSMQRFVLEVFAGFIILARFGRRPWFHEAYMLISLPMLAFLVFQFMTGHWTV